MNASPTATKNSPARKSVLRVMILSNLNPRGYWLPLPLARHARGQRE